MWARGRSGLPRPGGRRYPFALSPDGAAPAPPGGGIVRAVSLAVERSLHTREVTGSNPVPRTAVRQGHPVRQPPEKAQKFGEETAMGRPGQPAELAPVYVLPASDESSYATGQVYGASGGGGNA